MAESKQKLFITFDQLDRWVEEQRVDLFAEKVTFRPEGWTFRLTPACWFTREAAEQADAENLLGKIKTHDALTAMGGDIAHGTVIINDQAYDVVDGYTAEPVLQTDAEVITQSTDLDRAPPSGSPRGESVSSHRNAPPKPRKTDLDLLAKLLTGQNKK